MTNAQDRRYAAIQSVINTFLDEKGVWSHAWTRKEISHAIQSIAPLGRTDRWLNAVSGWQCLILDQDNDAHWALLQGSIMTAHNA